MMNRNTLRITTGGALVAIFAMILLLNRQTGGFFEEMFVYILPIPMVAYAAKFGWKSGVPVLIAMALISLIFGNITTIYYAVTEALIGLVLGGSIHRKADMTRTMFLIMFLSAVASLMNTVVLASLFGMDLADTIAGMQSMMDQVIEQYTRMSGLPPEQIEMLRSTFTSDFLYRMFIISMSMFGAVQGFLVFEISLMLLNRLKLPVPKPRSVFTFFPPRESLWIAVFFFCVYFLGVYRGFDPVWANRLQTCGIVAQLYLSLFGFLAVMLWMRIRMPKHRILGLLAAFGCFVVLPMLEVILGVMYIDGTWHQRWLEQAAEAEASN